jgi:hypothetical protein
MVSDAAVPWAEADDTRRAAEAPAARAATRRRMRVFFLMIDSLLRLDGVSVEAESR